MASRSETSFCFSANMVFRVFNWVSSFSMEISLPPSGAAESLVATQLLNSPTLPSSLFQHSTSVVILATHSLKHSWTTVHLSLKATTFSSASWWLVIFWAEAAASSNTLSLASALSWRFLLSPRISQASTRETGFLRPSCLRTSEFFIHGSNTLTPVWNSAQNLTSSENLAHSTLASSAKASNVARTFFNLSMNFFASLETFSPLLGKISSFNSIDLVTLSSGLISCGGLLMQSNLFLPSPNQFSMSLTPWSKMFNLLLKSSMNSNLSSVFFKISMSL